MDRMSNMFWVQTSWTDCNIPCPGGFSKRVHLSSSLFERVGSRWWRRREESMAASSPTPVTWLTRGNSWDLLRSIRLTLFRNLILADFCSFFSFLVLYKRDRKYIIKDKLKFYVRKLDRTDGGCFVIHSSEAIPWFDNINGIINRWLWSFVIDGIVFCFSNFQLPLLKSFQFFRIVLLRKPSNSADILSNAFDARHVLMHVQT